MSDTGSSRHHPPRAPQHRPPPLLVIAATGLAVVLGLGITLLILRARGDGGKSEATAAVLPPEPERPHTPPAVPAPARESAPVRAEVAAHTATQNAATVPAQDDVPEWERKPLRTAQPFPEEARFDPPTPPMKIPPEMLLPPAAPDAARTP